MSVLIVQVGQCGNQIGLKTFDNLFEEMKHSNEALSQTIADTFFSLNSNNEITANSLMLDMEPKVIEKCKISAKKQGWMYNDDYCIFKQEGSGNNWANGFFNHGPSISEKFIDKLNKISENIENLDSILLINSLAGGTGSGLGSYINMLIKDYFPLMNLINLSIWPHDSGEVIVNSYNTMLSISESYKASDAVFLVKNQDIYDICTEVYQNKFINFENLNHVISKHLISSILPTINSASKTVNPWRPFSPFIPILRGLCSDHKYKFLRVVSVPEIPEEHIQFTNDSWNRLAKKGFQLVNSGSNITKFNFSEEEPIKSRGNICIFRGKSANESQEEEKIFKDQKIYKNGIVNYTSVMDQHKIFKNDKHLTILNNSNFLNKDLDNTLNKASEMINSGAYLHQYKKYGIEKNDFFESMAITEQIVFDYNQ